MKVFILLALFVALVASQTTTIYTNCLEVLPVLPGFSFTVREKDTLTCSTSQCNKKSSVQSVSADILELVSIFGGNASLLHLGTSDGYCITTLDQGKGVYHQLCTQEYNLDFNFTPGCHFSGSVIATGIYQVADPIPVSLWTITGGRGAFADATGNITIRTVTEPFYENDFEISFS